MQPYFQLEANYLPIQPRHSFSQTEHSTNTTIQVICRYSPSWTTNSHTSTNSSHSIFKHASDTQTTGRFAPAVATQSRKEVNAMQTTSEMPSDLEQTSSMSSGRHPFLRLFVCVRDVIKVRKMNLPKTGIGEQL